MRKGLEECDDGNTESGDGCSSTCMVETGFACGGALGPKEGEPSPFVGGPDPCCEDPKCIGSSPPPPGLEPPADLCSSGSTGDCKFLINIRCADWRDSGNTYNKAKQEDYLSKCASQDCEQSLEPGNACRQV
jgi:cysteine-rich repeat protein